MATQADSNTDRRAPLSKERVLEAAVAFADASGIDSLSMRRLGQKLGVEAMSLYNHVANKDDILDGIVDLLIGEINVLAAGIEGPSAGGDWKTSMRRRAISARSVLVRHPWAPALIESRTNPGPETLQFFDSLIGLFLEAGFSIDLTHHALHVLGSRAFGFTQELYADDEQPDPETAAMMIQQMAGQYPNIAELAANVTHDDELMLGGCDDQFEFEFALDLILDGLERLRISA